LGKSQKYLVLLGTVAYLVLQSGLGPFIIHYICAQFFKVLFTVLFMAQH